MRFCGPQRVITVPQARFNAGSKRNAKPDEPLLNRVGAPIPGVRPQTKGYGMGMKAALERCSP